MNYKKGLKCFLYCDVLVIPPNHCPTTQNNTKPVLNWNSKWKSVMDLLFQTSLCFLRYFHEQYFQISAASQQWTHPVLINHYTCLSFKIGLIKMLFPGFTQSALNCLENHEQYVVDFLVSHSSLILWLSDTVDALFTNMLQFLQHFHLIHYCIVSKQRNQIMVDYPVGLWDSRANSFGNGILPSEKQPLTNWHHQNFINGKVIFLHMSMHGLIKLLLRWSQLE